MVMDVTKFHGIFPALVTPYTEAGDLHEESLRRLVSRCLDLGVRGFYVGGSTGEAFMLAADERRRILEIVADENGGRGTLIAHVGHISTDKSIDLAHHAKRIGVDAVSSIPPFYYSFSIDEVIGHYLSIVEEADVPMILYNFPAYSGFTLTPDLIVQLRGRDERIIGLKHTSMNLFDLEQVLRMDDRFIVLSGHDEVFLAAIAMGAHGAIGSTYNIMPELYLEMMELAGRGELAAARQAQQRVNSFIRLMASGTGIPQVKAALELLGIECNGCRRPIGRLSADARKEIEQTLRNIGVL